MQPNADITLYQLKDGNYTRQVIKGVYWFSVKQSNVLKTGLVDADKASIHVPVDAVDGLEVTTSKDMVARGIVDLEIDNTDQRTQSESLRALKESHEVYTITAFDPKLYGTKRLQHYELSCK